MLFSTKGALSCCGMFERGSLHDHNDGNVAPAVHSAELNQHGLKTGKCKLSGRNAQMFCPQLPLLMALLLKTAWFLIQGLARTVRRYKCSCFVSVQFSTLLGSCFPRAERPIVLHWRDDVKWCQILIQKHLLRKLSACCAVLWTLPFKTKIKIVLAMLHMWRVEVKTSHFCSRTGQCNLALFAAFSTALYHWVQTGIALHCNWLKKNFLSVLGEEINRCEAFGTCTCLGSVRKAFICCSHLLPLPIPYENKTTCSWWYCWY